MSQPSLLPTVTLVDGTPRVSSLHIAEHFGKRHERVLDAIRKIVNDLEPVFHEHNFVSMLVDVKIGNGAIRKSPSYSLTRDAFVLVVMGFTGKAALAWKVRYIEAFNQMEKALTGQAAIPSSQKIALPKSFHVSIIKGRPSTSTMEVASVFGKNDDDVMRDVQAIMANSPKEFNEHNFRFISAPMIDEPDITFYILTREAFMLLTRNYTGKKAMQVKVACIDAFNALEAMLMKQEQKALPQPALPVFSPKSTSRTTHAQRKELRDAINLWADTADTSRDVVAHQVRLRFGVTRTDRIPAEKLPEAVSWIRNAILECTTDNTPELMKWVRTQADTATKNLPDTARLFDDIRKAEKALQPVEHWTHLKVRWELRRKASTEAVDAVNMHVNAAWYALGLARSSLLAAIAVGKIA